MSNDSNIIRSRRKTPFTIIGNHVFEKNKLSLEATGLLCWLLEKPDNWKINVNAISNSFENTRKTAGKTVVRACLKELRESGYVTFSRRADGSTVWQIFDDPQNKQEIEPHSENQHEDDQQGFGPHAENPHVENPHVDNRHVLTNTQNAVNTHVLKNTQLCDSGIQLVVDLYAEMFKGQLPMPAKMSAARKSAIKARFKDVKSWSVGDEHPIKTVGDFMKWLSVFFAKIKNMPFYMGANDTGWKASIDYIFRESGFLKLVEYNGSKSAGFTKPVPSDLGQHGSQGGYIDPKQRKAG